MGPRLDLVTKPIAPEVVWRHYTEDAAKAFDDAESFRYRTNGTFIETFVAEFTLVGSTIDDKVRDEEGIIEIFPDTIVITTYTKVFYSHNPQNVFLVRPVMSEESLLKIGFVLNSEGENNHAA